MIRFGVISKVDADKCKVKVSFEEDDIESDWLPVMVQGSKDNRYFHIFDDGEHVACLMDENAENGVVIGAIYNSKEKPEAVKGKDIAGVEFKDGTTVKYDRSSHRLEVKMGQLELNLDKTKGFTLKKGSVSLKTLMKDQLTQLQAETHPTAVGPTGVPINSPAYAALSQLVETFFEE